MLANLYPRSSAAAPRTVRAKYDAAQTTRENRNQWKGADGLAPVAANSAAVRRLLRNRVRFECENDGYAAGMVSTLAADVVGTGPTLQCTYPGQDRANREIEQLWFDWCDATGYYDKLRILEKSRVRDGECFALFVTNPALRGRTPILLDLLLIEADQVADPYGFAMAARPNGDDGIECDVLGNPIAYHVLHRHPGDNRGLPGALQADRIPADNVLHWFLADRPGQLRGVTQLAPVLGLLPLLRRYGLATVTAAEVAANFSVMLETELPPPDGDAEVGEDFGEFDLPRMMGMTLPYGYKANQLKPEHPTSQFAPFEDAVLRRIGRSSDLPYGAVAGDHSKYNYSSARLDNRIREKRRDVTREQLRIRGLDRTFRLFAREADLLDLLPSAVVDPERIPHKWQYDADLSIDPLKDAAADDAMLKNGSANLADVLAARGKDWEEHLDVTARILAKAEALGLTAIVNQIKGVTVSAAVQVPTDPPEAPQ